MPPSVPRHDITVALGAIRGGTAPGVEILLDAVYEIALELVDILKAFVGHALPAELTLFPCPFRGFVAADMDILRREEIHDLGEHIFQNLEGLFVAYAYVGLTFGIVGA